MFKTSKTPRIGRRKRALILSSLGVVLLAALAAPSFASAALDDGGYCVKADGFDSEFQGFKGACHATEGGVTPEPTLPQDDEPWLPSQWQPGKAAFSDCRMMWPKFENEFTFKWEVEGYSGSQRAAAEEILTVDGAVVKRETVPLQKNNSTGYVKQIELDRALYPGASRFEYSVRVINAGHNLIGPWATIVVTGVGAGDGFACETS